MFVCGANIQPKNSIQSFVQHFFFGLKPLPVGFIKLLRTKTPYKYDFQYK
jgi:hypothetical protein